MRFRGVSLDRLCIMRASLKVARSELVSTSLPLLLSPLFIRLNWLAIGKDNGATAPQLLTLEFVGLVFAEPPLLLAPTLTLTALATAGCVVVIELEPIPLALLLFWLLLTRVLRFRLI